jgi:hypothetical protein
VIDTHFSSKTAKEDKPCDYRLLPLSFNGPLTGAPLLRVRVER